MRASGHPAFAVESTRVRRIAERLEQFVEGAFRGQATGQDPVRDYIAGSRRAEARQLLTVQALEDPVKGRIDIRDDAVAPVETFYIGYRNLDPEPGQDYGVIDWRAPMARLYFQSGCGQVTYRNGRDQSLDVWLLLKRALRVQNLELVDISDQDILDGYEPGEGGAVSHLVADEYLLSILSSPAGTHLREIIGTIQREQHQIIIAPTSGPLIVQAVAGSGKSTIALHRLAQILYDLRQGAQTNPRVAVFAPNAVLVGYVAQLLPSILESDVPHLTFRDWAVERVFGTPAGTDANRMGGRPPAIAREFQPDEAASRSIQAKGSASFRRALDRLAQAVSESRLPAADLAIGPAISCPARQIRAWYQEASHLAYRPRWAYVTDKLTQWARARAAELANQLTAAWDQLAGASDRLFPPGESRKQYVDDLMQRKTAAPSDLLQAVTRFVQGLGQNWQTFDMVGLYAELVTQPERLAQMFNIETDRVEAFCAYNRETVGRRKWDESDLAPLMYLYTVINGVPEDQKWHHVVVDEGQDLSPLHYAVLRLWVKDESITAVGDLAQGIGGPYGLANWESLRGSVFSPDQFRLRELKRTYRLTRQVTRLANRVLEAAALAAPTEFEAIRDGAEPTVQHFGNASDMTNMVTQYAVERATGERTVAVITPTAESAGRWAQWLQSAGLTATLLTDETSGYEGQLFVLPVTLSKGLEFDHVVVADADAEHYPATPGAAKRLYVAITRAKQHVAVVAETQLSPLLRGKTIGGRRK